MEMIVINNSWKVSLRYSPPELPPSVSVRRWAGVRAAGP